MSDVKSRLMYNSNRRLEKCLSGIKIDMEQTKIDPILNSSNLKNEGLTDIERQIKQLEDNVRSIRADGSADKYLIYEDQCRKLLTKLDDILLNTELERQQKRQDIERLVNCSKELKMSSVANLKQFLDLVRQRDFCNKHLEVYRHIEDVLNRSSGHTITEVDDLRFKLQDIKHNL